jgi:ABC-type uncharacterized transport system substrate-binding protein
MRRIGLAVVLALTIVCLPLAATAQQSGKVAKVGVLAARVVDDPELQVLWEAFTGGLRDFGWIENQNVVFERRTVVEGPERYSRPASELVSLHPDIIVSGLGEPGVLALKKTTTTIPIVMLVAADPLVPASSRASHDPAAM